MLDALLQRYNPTALARQLSDLSGLRCRYDDVVYMRDQGVPSHWLAHVVELLRREGLDPSADDILAMVRRTRRNKPMASSRTSLGTETENFGEAETAPQLHGEAA